MLAIPRAPAAQQTKGQGELEEAAVQALKAGDYERARELFREVLVRVTESGDSARVYFYLGLTDQQTALASGGEPRELVDRAAQNYQRALELRPDFSAALNNLAQLYARFGPDERAGELYARAVAVHEGDPRQAFYAANYADFLADQGMWKAASEYYTRALESSPSDPETRRRLLEVYARSDPKMAVRHLWEGIQLGAVNQTLQGALELLATEHRDKTEVLTIVVVALSEQYYEPSTFGATDTGERLRSLSDDPEVGAGIAQILLLHEGNDLEPQSYGWWAARGDIFEDPAFGMWPRDGFRQLIRSLGDRYRESGSLERAWRYYELSATLELEDPDPEAFLGIVDIALATGHLDSLEVFAERYVPTLFFGKHQAYKRSRYPEIYSYHRSLGVLFAHLERWGNSWTPASAIFQLEHALCAAWFHNTGETPPELPCGYDVGPGHEDVAEPVLVEPRVMESLAAAYKATDQADALPGIALSTAAMYVDQAEAETALGLLRVLEGRQLPPSARALYEELRAAAMRNKG